MRDLSVIQERFQITMELYALAVDMKRQSLKRQHPDETEAQIHERLDRWHAKRDTPPDCPPGFRRRTQ